VITRADAKLLAALTAAVQGSQVCFELCALDVLPLETELQVADAANYFLQAGEMLEELNERL